MDKNMELLDMMLDIIAGTSERKKTRSKTTPWWNRIS